MFFFRVILIFNLFTSIYVFLMRKNIRTITPRMELKFIFLNFLLNICIKII